MYQKSKELITLHEGYRTKAYKDSLGIWTIGIGFNLESISNLPKLNGLGLTPQELKEGRPLTDKEIDYLFEITYRECIAELPKLLPEWKDLDEDRSAAMVDLIYNLGLTKLSRFRNFLKYMKEKNYPYAALALSRSLWFEQVGVRGIRICSIILGDL